jgi:flagellar hook-associated protein 1 FlgK
MSLFGTLNIGQNALATQQTLLQVTGNNISNSGDPNYAREAVDLTPGEDQQLSQGVSVGTGVVLQDVQRQVDETLNSRLNSAVSDQQGASTAANWGGQVQSAFNELSGQGLSTSLDTYFSSWTNLANNPTDSGLRQDVIDTGSALASQFNSVSGQLGSLESNSLTQVDDLVSNVNQLSTQIATLNQQVSVAQASGGGTPNSLLDQRDAAISSLAKLANVMAVPQSDGTVSVFIGSQSLVSGFNSRSLVDNQNAQGNTVVSNIQFTDNSAAASITGGQIGGLLAAQSQINQVSGQVDNIAASVIQGVNQAYSSGQGQTGFTSVTGTNPVLSPSAALNSTAAGLNFPPTNGSFVVTVTNTGTGLQSSTLVPVTLNGLSSGQTTLNSLVSSLNGISNVSASVVGNKLQINAASGTQITFSQDSSGTLAALGVNTFFSGYGAGTISVNQNVQNNPQLLAAAQNGDPGDNQTALTIAGLGTAASTALGGQSINGNYQSLINQVGATAQTAQNEATATGNIASTLQTQQQSISGVSVDEETINLLQQQQSFQAAARLVSTVDTMMQTLIAMT